MNDIIIKIDTNRDISDFILETIEKIKEYFIEILDQTQLNRIDDYLKNHKNVLHYNQFYKKEKKIFSRDILIGAIENLKYQKSGKIYRIFINPNAVVPNTTTKFETLLCLIDKGNLELSPYSVWSDTIDYFCRIIPDLYRKYTEEEIDVHPTI